MLWTKWWDNEFWPPISLELTATSTWNFCHCDLIIRRHLRDNSVKKSWDQKRAKKLRFLGHSLICIICCMQIFFIISASSLSVRLSRRKFMDLYTHYIRIILYSFTIRYYRGEWAALGHFSVSIFFLGKKTIKNKKKYSSIAV